MNSVDWSAILTAVLSAAAVGAGGWLWLRLSSRGRLLLEKQPYLFVTLGVTLVSLIFSCVALWVALGQRSWDAGLPVGVVVTLDDQAGCAKLGTAWQDAGFGKRVIAGVDANDQAFSYRGRGGSGSVTLGPEHMPKIYIGFTPFLRGNDRTVHSPDSIGFVRPPGNNVLEGGNASPKSIELYPPYVALYLCRKVK